MKLFFNSLLGQFHNVRLWHSCKATCNCNVSLNIHTTWLFTLCTMYHTCSILYFIFKCSKNIVHLLSVKYRYIFSNQMSNVFNNFTASQSFWWMKNVNCCIGDMFRLFVNIYAPLGWWNLYAFYFWSFSPHIFCVCFLGNEHVMRACVRACVCVCVPEVATVNCMRSEWMILPPVAVFKILLIECSNMKVE